MRACALDFILFFSAYLISCVLEILRNFASFEAGLYTISYLFCLGECFKSFYSRFVAFWSLYFQYFPVLSFLPWSTRFSRISPACLFHSVVFVTIRVFPPVFGNAIRFFPIQFGFSDQLRSAPFLSCCHPLTEENLFSVWNFSPFSLMLPST